MKKQVIEAMRKRRLFDWLADNYDDLSKEDLRDIAKELAYAIEQSIEINNDRTAYFHAMQNLKENLLEDDE